MQGSISCADLGEVSQPDTEKQADKQDKDVIIKRILQERNSL